MCVCVVGRWASRRLEEKAGGLSVRQRESQKDYGSRNSSTGAVCVQVLIFGFFACSICVALAASQAAEAERRMIA